jgi:hypothetical protein
MKKNNLKGIIKVKINGQVIYIKDGRVVNE